MPPACFMAAGRAASPMRTAQNQPAALPPLPEAPLLERVFLEEPWPALLLVGLAGAIGVAVFWRRGRGGPALLAGAGAAVLGLGIWVLAAAVTTLRERLAEQTRALVAATATGDSATVRALLLESASLGVLGTRGNFDKARILRLVETDLQGPWRVVSHRVVSTQATLDGPSAGRTRVRVRVEPEATRVPVGSWWLLEWRMDAAGEWRVSSIRCEQIDGVPAGAPLGL